MLNKYKNILIFDVETTGLDFNESKIIEFGFIQIENNNIINEDTIFINWYDEIQNFNLPQNIQELTNITPQMLKEEGIPPTSAFNKISSLMLWANLYICHNSKFDMRMTSSFLKTYKNTDSFKKLCSHLSNNNPASPDYLDTLLIVGDNKTTGKHRLDAACEWCNVDIQNAHRAIDDTKATWKLLKAMATEKNIRINKYINMWGIYKKYHEDFTHPKKVSLVDISFGRKRVR